MPYFEYPKGKLNELLGLPKHESVTNSPYQNAALKVISLLGLDDPREALMNAVGGPMQIRGLYHGTSRRFPPTKRNKYGEFSDEFLGTGAGTQAFSYGHYSSTGPKVAKHYATEPEDMRGLDLLKHYSNVLQDDRKWEFFNRMLREYNDPWVDNMRKSIGGFDLSWNDTEFLDTIDRLIRSKELSEFGPQRLPTTWEELLRNQKQWMVPWTKAKPTVYELTAFPGAETPPMLKWYDKTPPDVSRRLPEGLSNLSGSDVWHTLVDVAGSDPAARDILKDAGIGGMEFPSGTVLGTRGGPPATNYVIYDPANLWIEGIYKGKY